MDKSLSAKVNCICDAGCAQDWLGIVGRVIACYSFEVESLKEQFEEQGDR